MLTSGTFAPGQGLLQRAENPIPGQYIVVLDDELLPVAAPQRSKPGNASESANAVVARRRVELPAKPKSIQEMAGAIAAERGLELRGTFKHALKGFVARMTRDQAESLAGVPWVTSIEEDGRVEVASTQTQSAPPSWGLDRIDQRGLPLDGAYLYNNTGAGVDVFVVDSGIRATHADFGGRVDTVKAFTAVDDDLGTEDCFGHGTMVAGIIGSASYGVAKGVTLHPVRVVDCSGMATISGVVSAVDWITAQFASQPAATRRSAVVNISLLTPASPAIDAAVANSIAAGIIYVAAAGNSARDACFYSPARVPGALTVGASNDADNVWIDSNGGSCIDLFAPGVQINTTFVRSDTDTTPTTGTSASAPHVTGAAALYLAANLSATPAAVSDALLTMATSNALGAVPADTPNRLLFTASIGLDP